MTGSRSAGAVPPRAAVPQLTGVVVHWRDEEALAELVDAWPRDPRFELVVVDNSGSGGSRRRAGAREGKDRAGAAAGETAPTEPVAAGAVPSGFSPRWIAPGCNLGFAGGVNRGVQESRGDLLLLLNPDARPEPGALEALVEGFAAHPEAAGLAPRLEGPGGDAQYRWQLKPLPGAARLVLEALFLPATSGPGREPPAAMPVEQPAAAALALRRRVFDAVGGMDPGFFPAWYEDVDLARRLRAAGDRLLYWPAARFRHGLGSTVPRLGFRTFLWLYYRSLTRYLAKHHGAAWALAARALLPVGMVLRLALLPIRRPRRAGTRSEAARGLAAVAVGAATGWRRPADLARRWARREPPDRRPAATRGGPEASS